MLETYEHTGCRLAGGELCFFEAPLKECFKFSKEGFHAFGGAFGAESEFGALSCSEHHEAHDALAVDFFSVLFDPDFTSVCVGNAYNHSSGTGVDAHFVLHRQLFGGGGV